MTIRALVTGITGQDGWYLTERLLADGVEVHGVVLPQDASVQDFRRDYPAAQLHTADLTEERTGWRLVQDVAPQEIYNLAGISSVATSWEKPGLTMRVNAAAVADLLMAAFELQERTGEAVRFLQASSAEIFGQATQFPQTERTAILPVNPYGAAKAAAHFLCQQLRARGLFAATAILYNHESPRRPETFVTRKITRTVARISRGEANVLELGNTHARRDWGWAPDYVDAMVRAVRHRVPDDFIIATGEDHSVLDFVREAFAAVGITGGAWVSHVQECENLKRPADATRVIGDAAHARQQLDWHPTKSFSQLVAAMVDADVAALSQKG